MNTNQKALFDKMVKTASQMSIEDMERVLREDIKNPELPSTVFDSILNALESKLSEEDFITFCEEIY